MQVGPQVLGYGSQGTMVFEGSLHGRSVAVKRMLRHLYHLARKEIDALILSDEHACVVRCFAMEEDAEFVYLALERCKQSLADLLSLNPPMEPLFVDSQAHPTPSCMQVAEDIGQGLLALHERGIVHRDLKPHNVLVTGQGRGKVSDMGHCKRLLDQQASFHSLGAGGSTGWQAPEQLIARSGGDARQGYTTDVFSYGMLLFYCLTAGKHPFGEHYERDFNILQGRHNLKSIAHLPEAQEMIRSMLAWQAGKRPSMKAVMQQPFWWSSARRLAFLVHLSDRVEMEDREVDQSLLQQLEATAEDALGGSDWATALGLEVVANLGKYRKYSSSSLRDLLRVIRNKHNHFREMPLSLQDQLGPLPEGFLRYFTTRFPRLLLTTYNFAEQHCSADPPLRDYFPHVPLQAGLLSPALPLPSAQATLEDASTGQLPLAATGAFPLVPLQHPSRAQTLEASHPLTSLPGNVARDGLTLLDRLQVPGVLSTPHLVGQQGDLQNPHHAEEECAVRENTVPHADVPPPWTDHPSTAAATGPAAHAHRQTWWPKQDSNLFKEPRCRDDSPLEQRPDFGVSDHTVDSSSPPNEASRMVPRAWKSADVSDHHEFLSMQQIDGSKRPAAASAAWCIQQQGAQGLESGVAQSCLQLHLSTGLDGACQQLRDEAWPPLPAQPWSLPTQQQPQQQQQQQLERDEPKVAVSEQHIDQVQQAVLAESQVSELSEDDMHCSPGGAGQKPYDSSSASIMPCHPGQSVVASQVSKDAGIHLAPASAPSGTCTDAASLFPQRPGHTSCQFYVRTGFCKFGEGCKFDHPPQFAVCLNRLGLPLRAQEATCPFYAKTGNCKFGPSCKFDHPRGHAG